MERAIVRESKFRHLHGQVWRKEVCVTNAKPCKSFAAIRGSTSFFALPWETQGGAINVLPLGYKGTRWFVVAVVVWWLFIVTLWLGVEYNQVTGCNQEQPWQVVLCRCRVVSYCIVLYRIVSYRVVS
jgi:hypothetical protein